MLPDARIAALYRYPVKGLSPESLEQVTLGPGDCFPWDRAYAIEQGKPVFDESKPSYFPKRFFLELMLHEELARLQTRFDEQSGFLTIHRGGDELLMANLNRPEGREAVEDFMADYMGARIKGRPRLVHAQGFSFSDVPAKYVSFINLESVRELEKAVGRPVDPLRFRGNVYVEGLGPWEDHQWVGNKITIGTVELEGIEPIVRCAATNVDPVSGARDMKLPATLMQTYGHSFLGLYARVTGAGLCSVGDPLSIA